MQQDPLPNSNRVAGLPEPWTEGPKPACGWSSRVLTPPNALTESALWLPQELVPPRFHREAGGTPETPPVPAWPGENPPD